MISHIGIEPCNTNEENNCEIGFTSITAYWTNGKDIKSCTKAITNIPAPSFWKNGKKKIEKGWHFDVLRKCRKIKNTYEAFFRFLLFVKT